jgi:hypothetical protein
VSSQSAAFNAYVVLDVATDLRAGTLGVCQQICPKIILLLSSLTTVHFSNIMAFERATRIFDAPELAYITHILLDLELDVDLRITTLSFMNELRRQGGGRISDLILNVEIVVLYDTYPAGQGRVDYHECMQVTRTKYTLLDWFKDGVYGRVRLGMWGSNAEICWVMIGSWERRGLEAE